MHKNIIFQPKQFACLANCTVTRVWLRAQAAQLSQLSVSRTKCNLTWQQLGDKFVWDTKLFPQLELQRRAGLTAPRWGSSPHPSFGPVLPCLSEE